MRGPRKTGATTALLGLSALFGAACGEIQQASGPDPIIGVWSRAGIAVLEFRPSGDIHYCIYGRTTGGWRSVGAQRYTLMMLSDVDAAPFDVARVMRGEQDVTTANAYVNGDVLHIEYTMRANGGSEADDDAINLSRVTDSNALAECE